MLRRLALASAGLAAGISVLGWAGASGGPLEISAAAAPPPLPPPTPLAPLALASPRATPGRELRWDVDVARIAAFTSTEDARSCFRLRGEWSVTFVARAGGLTRQRVALEHATVEVGGQLDASDLSVAVMQPFWIDEAPDGHLVGLLFDRDTSAEARGLLRAAAAVLQVSTGAGDAWSSLEQDEAGEYEVRYARGADGSLTKRRARVVRVAGAHGLRVPTDPSEVLVRDSARLRLGADGDLESLELHGTVSSALRSTHDAGGTSTWHATAQLRSRGVRPAVAAALAAARERLEPCPVAGPPTGAAATPAAAPRPDEHVVPATLPEPASSDAGTPMLPWGVFVRVR